MAYRSYFTPRAGLFLAAGLVSLSVLALLLAWVSNNYQGVDGWGAFLGALLSCVLLLGAVAWGLRNERLPGWLLACLALAVVLRLLAAVLWFTMLPVHGYHSPAEQSGYVMADASERDRTAWDLGQSDKPLLRAFQGGYRKADQYGRLLFLSAFVYRILGGAAHQPLLIIVLTASFSSLAILFAWALARRAWGEPAAQWAAWGLAFYPEAILLGSSQMRE